jgi:hypothetical protein
MHDGVGIVDDIDGWNYDFDITESQKMTHPYSGPYEGRTPYEAYDKLLAAGLITR